MANKTKQSRVQTVVYASYNQWMRQVNQMVKACRCPDFDLLRSQNFRAFLRARSIILNRIVTTVCYASPWCNRQNKQRLVKAWKECRKFHKV